MADHDVAHDLTIGLGDESPLWHVVAGSSDPINKYSFCFRLKRRRNDSADRVVVVGGLGADDNGRDRLSRDDSHRVETRPPASIEHDDASNPYPLPPITRVILMASATVLRAAGSMA